MLCFPIPRCSNGFFRSRFGPKVVQVVAILLVSFFFFPACESDYSKATPFSPRQAIPMGDGNLSVAYVEETTQFVPDTSSKNVAVFLDSRDFYSLLQKQDHSAKDLRSVLSLLSLIILDREGKKYGPGVPMREKDYRMAQAGASGDVEAGWSAMMGQTGENVVVLFAVPHNSRGFTLYLKNPWPKEGQPQLAAVDLGR